MCLCDVTRPYASRSSLRSSALLVASAAKHVSSFPVEFASPQRHCVPLRRPACLRFPSTLRFLFALFEVWEVRLVAPAS